MFLLKGMHKMVWNSFCPQGTELVPLCLYLHAIFFPLLYQFRKNLLQVIMESPPAYVIIATNRYDNRKYAITQERVERFG